MICKTCLTLIAKHVVHKRQFWNALRAYYVRAWQLYGFILIGPYFGFFISNTENTAFLFYIFFRNFY
jgi:hypothetical protein